MFKQGDQPILPLVEIAEKCKLYPDVISNVQQYLISLKQEILSYEFQNCYEEQRNIFYQSFETKLRAMQQTKELKKYISDDIFDIDSYEKECIPFLKNKFQKVSDSFNKQLQGQSLLKRNQFDALRISYDNLLSFDKNVRISDIQVNQFIECIKQTIKEKVQSLQNIIQISNDNKKLISDCLIEMKNLSDNLISFKTEIDLNIDESLKQFRVKNKYDGGKSLAILATFLQQDSNGIGPGIISEHKCFQGQEISIFNQQTQKHDITYIIQYIKGDKLLSIQLLSYFSEYKNNYDETVKRYLIKLDQNKGNEGNTLTDLVDEIKSISSKENKQKNGKLVWDNDTRQKASKLIAYVFALWTLKNVEHYYEMKGIDQRDNYLLVNAWIWVWRKIRKEGGFFQRGFDKIAGRDEFYETIETGLKNNLVQIGTGEGKSVILAVVSIILALLGADVSCACYSEYLSKRDYENFLSLFDSLGVTEYIHYGTFPDICESAINERGDVRKRVLDLFNAHQSENKKKIENETLKRPKVLFIDEVDVFFSPQFYGNIYTPLTRLQDPTILELTNYIWSNQDQKISLRRLEQTTQYQQCCNRFQGWEHLIKESVKDMLSDLYNYKHDYLVIEDKIGYKEHDGISFKMNFGYKTMFAYYKEHQNNKITQQSLNENVFIGIRCGNFSYAEIPSTFEYIMGVTGTLDSLNQQQSEIIHNVYNIQHKTFIPSVFGQNKRVFAEVSDVFVENKDNYFKTIREQINNKIVRGKEKRAVFVFFDSKEKLIEFYNSQELAPIRSDVQIITEEVSNSVKEKSLLIKRATTSGQITLISKAFGRGTDFICRDQTVIINGGVHLIQTFFSEDNSEEIQIMGRIARQGQEGSFSMVLLEDDLEKFLGPDFRATIKTMRDNSNIYQSLKLQREKLSSNKYKEINKYVKLAEKEHQQAQVFVQGLNDNNLEVINQHLSEQNKGNYSSYYSRTLCLMDATGSMQNLLDQVKNTVETMFERATIILKDNGISDNCFQIQFAVYRDYDCMVDGLLQQSPWESKPSNLRQFIKQIKAHGGGDYEEAIEIGLQHANNEHKEDDISQVILIGDAPAKSITEIKEYRKEYGGEEYWANSKFKKITHYKNEIEKLKAQNIPVHTFYIKDGAKQNFEEIANITGGRCEYLNIDSSDSSQLLTNIVTETILSNIGNKNGKGNALVEDYKRRFEKSYK